MTQRLLFSPWPIRLHERRKLECSSQLLARQQSSSRIQSGFPALASAMNETPKRIPHGGERAANVDLSVYVECEKLTICRTKCYNRLVPFKNALHKVDEINKEIQSNFQGDVPLRFKTVKRLPRHTRCEKRSKFWWSRFVFRPKGITRQSKRRSCDSCCKPWSQPDPIRSYKSLRSFGAWFCTTKTPNSAVGKSLHGCSASCNVNINTARR